MKTDKTNTVFCNKVKKMETNDLLTEIFRRLESFIRFYGYSPKNILLNKEDYYRIQNYNEYILRNIDNIDYLLCMRVYYE